MASRELVGFVGLDDLSLEIATLLVNSGYRVKAFEACKRTMDGFLKLGGAKCSSPMDATKDSASVIASLSHPDQIDNLIFGKEGVVKGLHNDAVVILRSTSSPDYVEKLKCLVDAKSTHIVDAYMFKGVSKSLHGKIVVVASGKLEAVAKAHSLLSAMSGHLHVYEGEVGVGSKIQMIIELLKGIHFVTSMEAMFLGTQAGLHPWILYDIISNAAGNSWIFSSCVSQILRGSYTEGHSLKDFVYNLGLVLFMAKSLKFPLPLLSVAHQQLINGSCNFGDSRDVDYAMLVNVWEKTLGISVTNASNAETYSPKELANQITSTSTSVKRIGFIGLGAMGFGMATHLLRSKFCVIGYDVYKPTLSKFANAGGLVGSTPAEVSKDVDVLIVMVANEDQVESALYGESGAVSALPAGASIILSSTVSPGFVKRLDKRLQEENKSLKFVDAPVSGGVKRAADGTLTIIASGTEEALKCTGLILSASSENLYIIKGGCGAGSCVKMVNQLLAGVHITASAEAMAFGARMGLDTRMLFEVITNSSGSSWMFENRVPHMLDNDYTPYSALDIFVKDLGIVCHESMVRKVPIFVSTVAYQLFIAGSASGWGRVDDSGVVKVYEALTGVKVEGRLPVLKKDDVLNSLPPDWPKDPISDIQELERLNASKILVVLDDDPTGTQTVHDVDVLTEWNVESLVEQFSRRPGCFFILTNSRSLSPDRAISLIKDICKSIDTAAKSIKGIEYTIVLRGDSTLRGHFPEEADAAVSIMGEMDAWIICPFFLQGGRYTIRDIHYVADADRLVPAGQTEFAKDAAFGYKASNLRKWVEEKTKGQVPAESVASISINLLRGGGPSAVCELLCSLPKGSVCIVNAASERDVAVFALGMLQAEMKGKRFLCRTAASFVSARIGIKPKTPIAPRDIGIHNDRNGGLLVVGSYVPKTTKQIEALKSHCGHFLKIIEVSVDKLAMKSLEEREEEINYTAEMANTFLRLQKDTLIMTSRDLVKGNSPSESLEINFKVSSALVELVRRINTRPRYILAKGGITSSDLATKALEAKRAKVVGQALAGVPLWLLGPGSRYPGVPYIVFPGNVGDNNAVADVVKIWSGPSRPSTKDLLLDAENGRYAVGAFNVYNLEGIEAVVAAAEEEKSPAILQIHTSALKQGGKPLVACCISAAEQASVPVSVHFDHGTSKNDLLQAIETGFDSVMIDGSHLSFNENISCTKDISFFAHAKNMLVEAELGRLSGTEDDLTVEDYEARLTDVTQAQEFIEKTGIDALAVCIGNVHGKYPESGPNLRLELLKDLRVVTSAKGTILVLHGASGLPEELIKECIKLGVRKFNVNTEVRNAYLESLRNPKTDLIYVMTAAKEAMKAVVAEKMHLFGSAGKAT